LLGALATQASEAIHPNGMTSLPEDRATVVGHPSQGDVHIMTALINLHLKIGLGPSLAGGIAYLKDQTTVKAVLAKHWRWGIDWG
jgi:hypothetical protein